MLWPIDRSAGSDRVLGGLIRTAVSSIPDPYTPSTVVSQFLSTTLLQMDFRGLAAQAPSTAVPPVQRKATKTRNERRGIARRGHGQRYVTNNWVAIRHQRHLHRWRSSERPLEQRQRGQTEDPTRIRYEGGQGGSKRTNKSPERSGSFAPRTGLCPFHIAELLKVTLESGKTFRCDAKTCGRKHADFLKAITRGAAKSTLLGAPHKGLSGVAEKTVGGAPRGTFQDE